MIVLADAVTSTYQHDGRQAFKMSNNRVIGGSPTPQDIERQSSRAAFVQSLKSPNVDDAASAAAKLSYEVNTAFKFATLLSRRHSPN